MHLLPLLSFAVVGVLEVWAIVCNSDNCYNNLLHHTATSFCATYTTTINTFTTGLPTYIPSSCAATPSRISSACSCLYPSPTPAPTGQPCVLHNGDFGLDPWVNEDIVNESSYGYNQPVVSGPGYGSESAVLISFPADGIYELDQYVTFPSTPTTYTLSFYAYTNNPGSYCSIYTVFGAVGTAYYAENQFSLTSSYAQYSITGTTDGTTRGFVALVAQCEEGTNNQVWIDVINLG